MYIFRNNQIITVARGAVRTQANYGSTWETRISTQIKGVTAICIAITNIGIPAYGGIVGATVYVAPAGSGIITNRANDIQVLKGVNGAPHAINIAFLEGIH